MLSLHNIAYQYPGRVKPFLVSVDNLTFTPGAITCILGKNGSGKTTLLNIIGGHLKPQTGSVILAEEDISALTANLRPTSTVFQQLGLFPHLTVAGNIEIAIEPNTIFSVSQATKSKTSTVLEEFGLSEYRDRLPKALSVGQQQKVAIARALSSDPKVLLLDEPTSALDFSTISNLKQILFNLQKKQVVSFIIIVSHDLPFVMGIADSIKYIENGKLLFEGSSAEFKSTQFYIN